MRYFELTDDMMISKRWHVGEILLPDNTEPRLRAGLRFEDSRPLHAKVHHMGRVLDFCRTTFAVPIASGVLAAAMQAVVGSDLQCIPVAIGGQSGMVALNALRVLRCVDEMHSIFVRWTLQDHRPDLVGQYRYFDRLILDRVAIPSNTHMFRIEGSLIELIVSEKVKNAMERVGCVGAEFTELEMA